MGSGQTGSSQQSGSTGVSIPGWLRPYYKKTAQELEAAQGALPNITQLYSMIPELQIGNLSAQELGLINQIQGVDPNNPLMKESASGLEQFLGQSGKPSEATQAALKEFQDLQAPEIQGQAALMGLGNSGASLAALAQGQEQALVPFMQQDLQNQLTASAQLGQLGGQEFQQQEQALGAALQAAGMPREIANQQAKALYDQLMQKGQFAAGIQTGGQSQFPSLLGQISNSIGSTSAPKF